MYTVKHSEVLLFLSIVGPRRDQEEVAKVALAKIHGLRHQIPTSVYWQQQQLQHPDLHADTMQPQNTAGLILL